MSDKLHPMVRRALSFVLVISAGVLYAVALKYFVLPSRVILTGTEGIATALSYYFDSYSLFIVLYVVFQAALLVFAFARVGRRFTLRSLLVVSTVVVCLAFLPELRFARPEPENERIILVIFGGLLAGVAKAIAFRNRGSTGDEDILAAYFAMKYLRPVGSIAVIAAIGSTGFGLIMEFIKSGHFEPVVNTLMYTCIYIFVSAQTLNTLYRKFKITLVTIITRRHETVGDAIAAAFDHRTYTVQEGMGGRSGESFQLVRSIVTHEELPRLLAAVEQAEPDCLHYHHDIEGISSRYYITPIS